MELHCILQRKTTKDHSHRLYRNTCSSIQMEIEAVTQGSNWLMTQRVKQTTIIMESQNLLRKIEHCTLRREWLDIMSKMQIQKITWIYCSGHSNIVDSEKANQLAATHWETSVWTNKTCINLSGVKLKNLHKCFLKSTYNAHLSELHVL